MAVIDIASESYYFKKETVVKSFLDIPPPLKYGYLVIKYGRSVRGRVDFKEAMSRRAASS
jgi:hypothetical protein